MKKNLRVPTHVTVETEGTHRNGNCEMVYDATDAVFYASQMDAANALGVTQASVSHCCTGKMKTCKGHVLMFAGHAVERLDSIAKRQRDMAEQLALAKERESKANGIISGFVAMLNEMTGNQYVIIDINEYKELKKRNAKNLSA